MIRYIEVEIIKDLYLPRFKVEAGFRWKKAPHNIGENGFSLGGGFIANSEYKPVGVIKKKREKGKG